MCSTPQKSPHEKSLKFNLEHLVIVLCTSLWCAPVHSDYFNDQGNIEGFFRTDYEEDDEGTVANPLSVATGGCYFPQSEYNTTIFIEVHKSKACPNNPKDYQGGPFYYSNLPPNEDSFWVVTSNVESFSWARANPHAPLGSDQGAPNTSTSLTGSPDLLNFSMIPHPLLQNPPEKYFTHIIVDNEDTNGPKFDDAIPFLSVGSHRDWGNTVRVGRMNVSGAPHKTTWKSKVNIANTEDGAALAHYVIAVAKWGGKNRMIQVTLYHDLIDNSTSSEVTHRHWNWPASDSVWYPGADIVFIDAEDIGAYCETGVGTVPRITNIGQEYSYSLDWEALYECLSDDFDNPMPSTTVSILGVHWAAEAFDEASIWVIISDMKMAL